MTIDSYTSSLVQSSKSSQKLTQMNKDEKSGAQLCFSISMHFPFLQAQMVTILEFWDNYGGRGGKHSKNWSLGSLCKLSEDLFEYYFIIQKISSVNFFIYLIVK